MSLRNRRLAIADAPDQAPTSPAPQPSVPSRPEEANSSTHDITVRRGAPVKPFNPLQHPSPAPLRTARPIRPLTASAPVQIPVTVASPKAMPEDSPEPAMQIPVSAVPPQAVPEHTTVPSLVTVALQRIAEPAPAALMNSETTVSPAPTPVPVQEFIPHTTEPSEGVLATAPVMAPAYEPVTPHVHVQAPVPAPVPYQADVPIQAPTQAPAPVPAPAPPESPVATPDSPHAAPQDPVTVKAKRKKRRFKIGFAAGVAVLIVAIVSVVGSSAIGGSASERQSKAEDTNLAAQVTKLAGITTGEVPSVLTVQDKSKVDQPFLNVAENGDRVFLYYTSQKVVLYRPGTKEIVKTGSFVPPSPKVFIREGSPTKAAEKIKSVLRSDKDYTLTSVDQSSHLDYTETLVLDLSGHYKESAKKLADKLGATVITTLPTGETTPEADILVIAGKTQK